MSGLSFTGKVVLVTGASSTLGTEIAKYFSKLGASLVLTDSDKSHLNKIGDECSGGSVVKIAADLTKSDDATSVIKQAISECKKLDVLINCIGPLENRSTDGDSSLDVFDMMMKVRVCAVHRLTQAAHPYLVKTKGNVVNVCLSSHHVPSHNLSCNVSKSALDELTRSLALLYSLEGVRVNAVSSGLVDPELQGKTCEKIPGSRSHLGPEDVAAAVVFLASDLASFIAGAIIPVDGGKHLTASRNPDQVNKNPDKLANQSGKPVVLKLDPGKPDSHKQDQYHGDSTKQGSAKREDAHPPRDDPTKPSSLKNDSRKTDSEKPTAKQQPQEKSVKSGQQKS